MTYLDHPRLSILLIRSLNTFYKDFSPPTFITLQRWLQEPGRPMIPTTQHGQPDSCWLCRDRSSSQWGTCRSCQQHTCDKCMSPQRSPLLCRTCTITSTMNWTKLLCRTRQGQVACNFCTELPAWATCELDTCREPVCLQHSNWKWSQSQPKLVCEHCKFMPDYTAKGTELPCWFF